MPFPPHVRAIGLLVVSAALGLAGCSDEAAPKKTESLATCAQGAKCGDGLVFLADRLNFAVQASDGTAPGFDLDGIASSGDGPYDCYKEDLRSPEGDEGVDNQFGAILSALPTQVQTILPAAVQSSINDGGLLMLIEFANAESLDGAGGTGVVFRYGTGVPLKGTDGELLPNQTIALDPDPVLGYAPGAAGARGVEGGPLDLRFRMRFIATPVQFYFHRVRFRFVREPDGTLQGIAGGVVTLDDVLAVLGLLGGDDTALRETLKGIFPGLADVYNPAAKKCDAISGTLEFHAIPAFIYAGDATSPP